MNTLIWPQNIPSLETDDLILRPIEAADTESYFRLCGDPEVMRGWGTAAHADPGQTEKLIAYLHDGFAKKESIRWGVVLKEQPGEIVGDVGFWRFVPARCRAEVGAKLARHLWRKSYTGQALERILRYGFEEMNLNSVEGNAEPGNAASLRMIEKLGFVREGLLREHSFNAEKGIYVDTYIYTLHRSRWTAR